MLKKDRKILLKYIKSNDLKQKLEKNQYNATDLINILKEIGVILQQSSQLDDKSAIDMIRLTDAASNITREYCIRYA